MSTSEIKIAIERKEALKILEKLIGLTTDNGEKPILKTIMFHFSKTKVRVASTNLQVYASYETTLKSPIEACEDICLEGRILFEFIRKADGEDLQMIIKENNKIELICGENKIDLQYQSATEFPTLGAKEEGAIDVKIKDELFSKAVKHVAFAVATDQQRPQLTCVNVKLKNKKMSVAGIDGQRVSVFEVVIDDATEDSDIDINVPGESMKSLINIISKVSQDIRITMGTNFLTVKQPNLTVVVKLHEKGYLDYFGLIPKPKEDNKSPYVASLGVKRSLFTSGLELMELMKEKSGARVTLDIQENVMILSAVNETGNVTKKLPVEHAGIDMKISYNSQYLLDALKVIETDDIELYFTGETGPAILKPHGGYKYLYLVLPLRNRQDNQNKA